MKLILVDTNRELCDRWHYHFGGYINHNANPDVEIHHSRFEDLPVDYDCLVAAGNSFGLMDGGVDLAIARHFPGVESNVQASVRYHHGELNVGQSVIVRAGVGKLLAYTPTMRVPMTIAGTDAVYRSMWAALCAVDAYNRSGASPMIETLACPGLGTLAGRVPPDEGARQMFLAWAHFHQPPVIDWPTAMAKQRSISG